MATIALPIRRANSGTAGVNHPKIAPELLQALESAETTEFIIYLAQQADLSAAAALSDKAAKGQLVHRLLTETAHQTQAPLLRQLDERGLTYRPYWIANMIWVRGDESALLSLAAQPTVAYLYANTYRRFQEPLSSYAAQPATPHGERTNIEHINAPLLWAEGYFGQGAVIGGQDTGYDWDHPALINQYRGWDGSVATHDFNWHDAVHSGGGVCGADATEPCDDHGHGTHTMGTMVGDGGSGNQIGAAPGARWIGCRNMDRGDGSPITYSECFQWFVAPTDSSGNNANPDMAPHIINNSWACPPGEGCNEATMLQTVVENVRAAGILVVASAGNSGSIGCGSVLYAPAIYDATLSVGATWVNNDAIASFSSRGPVQADGSNRLKPDAVAPGVAIRSSIPGGHYGLSSGTSMAAPHVAGLAALLISVQPSLAGNVDALQQAILFGALPLVTDETCGGLPPGAVPNHTFGYGRIDAWRSLQTLQVSYHYYIPTSMNAAAQ